MSLPAENIHSPSTMSEAAFLAELEPTAEVLLSKHLSTAKQWYPHTLIPLDLAESFPPDYQWQESEAPLAPGIRSALYVNLLTEDNLPYYFRDIERMFGREGAWGEWNRRWTAEEGRHSIVLRDYLTATRLVDPVKLEDGRMAQMSRGEVPEPPTALRGVIYVTLQELATRVSHHNTGKLLRQTADHADSDATAKVIAESGYQVMSRVGNDENLHHLFYRGVASAASELDPSRFVIEVDKVVTQFDMPGTGIPNFRRHAAKIAIEGIYGMSEFVGSVVRPVLDRQWRIWDIEGLSPEAEQARDNTANYLDGMKSAIESEREAREKKAAKVAAG